MCHFFSIEKNNFPKQQRLIITILINYFDFFLKIINLSQFVMLLYNRFGKRRRSWALLLKPTLVQIV
jgi:hypothetical protein